MNRQAKARVRSAKEVIQYDHPELPYYVRRSWGRVLSNDRAMHWHPDVEFILVLKGERRYRFLSEEQIVKEGDGIFINSRVAHRSNSRSADFITVRFHPILLCVNEYFEREYVQPLIQEDSIPYCYLDQQVSWQKDILDWIREIYMFSAAGPETAPLLTVSIFMSMWSVLYTNLPKDTGPKYNLKMTTVKKMIGYIQEHWQETVRLEDIAEAGNVSLTVCNELFDEIVKDSPYHYLQVYRLYQAESILLSSDDTVTQIAMHCGFSDSSHFIRAFRAEFDMTPAKYRKAFTKR